METEATITTTQAQLNKLIEVSSVGYFDDLYLNVEDGRVRVLVGKPGASSGGYIDFVEAFFEDVSGETEAYLDVGEMQNYLSLVSDSQSTKLTVLFEGTESDRLANRVQIEPSELDNEFTVSMVLPSGESVIESIPASIVQRFDSEDQMIHPEEERPPRAMVDTYIDALRKIKDAVDLRDDLEHYPLTVENEEFRLDVGSEANQLVNARLQGSVEVSGDGDHSQQYSGSFPDIVQTLDGSIHVEFEGGSPVLLRQQRNHYTVRHMIGAVR